MKSTGIVRKLDNLGRIVIPIELRHELGIKERGPVEIYTQGASIILKKHEEITECDTCKTIIDKTDRYCKCCGKEVNRN